jgi:hypothetical protein
MRTKMSQLTLNTAFIVLLIGILCSGCGPRSGNPYSLDESLAKQSMERFLETWKNGGDIKSLKSGEPPVIARDSDWEKGLALVDYEIPNECSDDGTNLYLDICLTLAKNSDAPKTKVIRYVVGTSPVVTVFRDQ